MSPRTFAYWFAARTAQQLGALAAVPGAGLHIALVSGAFTLDLALAVICGVLAVVDTALSSRPARRSTARRSSPAGRDLRPC
jgi:hypothetical protein